MDGRYQSLASTSGSTHHKVVVANQQYASAIPPSLGSLAHLFLEIVLNFEPSYDMEPEDDKRLDEI